MKIFDRKKRIYADWAATTPVNKSVLKEMNKSIKYWFNPSAIYKEGVREKNILDDLRSKCSKVLSVKSDEVYFTSGGTESNNLIIRGLIDSYIKENNKKYSDVHAITSVIEHSSVLETFKELELLGLHVDYIGVNTDGIINHEDVLEKIKDNTILVSIMYVNNEIGTIQPVSKIGGGIRKIRGNKIYPVFHSDTSQAPLWLSCELEGLRVDALTLDAHKMQGPKGVGSLILRRNINCSPILFGGGQERGLRPTTENIYLITGFVHSLVLAQKNKDFIFNKALKMQKYFLNKLEKHKEILINGSVDKRVPNNINISIQNINDPELVVLKMDSFGIACSTKSSCLKGEELSYVVNAIDTENKWRAKNTMRFTFSPDISKKEIDYIINSLLKV